MPVPDAPPATPPWFERPWAVTTAGLLALAVAMGVGRFAFTPLLPMMLHDGVVTLADGSWLATANYIGYLVGAMACTALPWLAPRLYERLGPALLARAGLLATVVLTLAMVLPFAASWPTLRFAAGVVSAFVLLNVAAWCMVRLTVLGCPAMGGFIFAGPGLGIVLTGLVASAMVALGWRAVTGWLVFGALAVLWCLPIWPVMRGRADLGANAPAQAMQAAEAVPPMGGPPLARALHALGQIMGPLITAWFLAAHGQARGCALGLGFAAWALSLGVVIYVGSALRWKVLP